IYGTVERIEAVVRHHDDVGVGKSRCHFTNGGVHIPINIQEFALVLSPKHVRVLVNGREVEKQQTLPETIERVAQQFQLVVSHQRALLQELFDRQNTLAKGGGVFGDTLRIERSDVARNGAAVGKRKGDRQVRRPRGGISPGRGKEPPGG